MTQAIQKPDQTHAEALAKVAALIKKTPLCMFATVDADGRLVSRPLGALNHAFDGVLWFASQDGTRKVEQIGRNDRVNLSFASSSAWVSITGTATVVRDPAKARQLWSPAVDAWFPQGPQADDIVLIKVEAEGAEYWDTPGGPITASVLSFIKAKTTGEPYKVENDRLAV